MDQHFEAGMMLAMEHGTVSVPYMLLKYYRQLELSEIEAMLLIHLIAFREKERLGFPSIKDLEMRMSAKSSQVIDALQSLVERRLLSIGEENDAASGRRYERYEIEGVLRRLAQCAAAEQASGLAGVISTLDLASKKASHAADLHPSQAEQEKSLFTVFEQEFARPLSPMECETIATWLDQDQYPVELILFALKEAVFAGKVHLRYIDRILFEWGRNRITSIEQARDFTRKFRGAR